MPDFLFGLVGVLFLPVSCLIIARIVIWQNDRMIAEVQEANRMRNADLRNSP